METKNVITIGSIIGIVGLLILGGIKLTDDNVYYCGDKQIVMQCDKLTKYYGLANGKCYNELGNKVCRSGWVEVVGERNITKQETLKIQYKGREWLCEGNDPYSICTRGGTHQAYLFQLGK